MKKQNILNVYNTITIVLLNLLMYLLMSEKILYIVVESWIMKCVTIVFIINFFSLTFINLKNKNENNFFKFNNVVIIFLQIIGIITINTTDSSLMTILIRIYYLVNIIFLFINLFGILYNWLYSEKKRILKIIYMSIFVICLMLVFNYDVIGKYFIQSDYYLEDIAITLLNLSIIFIPLNILNLIIYRKHKSKGDAILFGISSLCYIIILCIELFGFSYFCDNLLNNLVYEINKKYVTQGYNSNTIVAHKNNKAGLISADTGENIVECKYRYILQTNAGEKTDFYLCRVYDKEKYHLLLKDGTFIGSAKDSYSLIQILSKLLENIDIQDEYIYSTVFNKIKQEYSIFNYLKPVQSKGNVYYYNFNEKYDLKLIYDFQNDKYNLYSKNKETNVITKINKKNDILILKIYSDDDIRIKTYSNGSIPFNNNGIQEGVFNEDLKRIELKNLPEGEIINILKDKYIFYVYDEVPQNNYYCFRNNITNEIESDKYSELGIIDDKYIIFRDEKMYTITDLDNNVIRNDIVKIYRYLDKYIVIDVNGNSYLTDSEFNNISDCYDFLSSISISLYMQNAQFLSLYSY